MKLSGPTGAVALTLLLIASTILVVAGPAGLPQSHLPSTTSSTSVGAAAWSVDALRSSPLSSVRDPEPGLGLSGAIAIGPPSVSSLLIVVSFPIQHSPHLAQFLRSLSDPTSSLYHRYLTASAFDAMYGGNATAYAAADAYFQSFGVGSLRTSADRLTLTFMATPAQIQEIFHTSVEQFALRGQTYVAPTGVPELPSELASAISSVEGLSTYSSLLIHTDSSSAVVRSAAGTHAAPRVSTAVYLQPATVNGVQYEYAPDFQVAYDELSLFQDSGYPTNAVVATILWAGTDASGAAVGPYVPSDISDFFNETLPAAQPHASVNGVPLYGALPPGASASYDATGANVENTLDLEMVGSTAPGASIYNVYGPTASFANLDAAFSYILNPTHTPGLANVNVITNSWGGSDTNDTTWMGYLEEAQARGISVLASSGDAADNPASSKWSGTTVEFPSSMAYNTFGVTAVGGTTVTLNPSLQLASQVAWNISAADTTDGGPAGSTGGISTVFPEPSWQLATSANAVIGGAGRGVPDIAAIANNTLITINLDGYQYQAWNATHGGRFDASWGTSIASPLTAGLVAEIDHVLAAHGNAALGFLNPQLYALANMEFAPLTSTATTGYDVTGSYVSPLPTLPLLDVTTGANYVYKALAGYDLVTGWGSLDAYNYTMYFLSVPSAGVYGRLSGVEDYLSLSNLGVTSYFSGGGVNTQFNASIQQNFFLANSLGAPIYWIQNVIYITNTSRGWAMTDSGWVVYPFYGLYPSDTIYEYNFPSGQYVSLPSNFDVKTVLQSPAGFNAQYVTFSVGANTVTLPVPGAAYIIGSLGYNYSWQGVNYTNGPYPNNQVPGGLSPQFGLVGGPSLATGVFAHPTSGNLTARVLPYGSSKFIPAATKSFGGNVDQTGEAAANLAWTQQSGQNWSLGILSASTTQGVLSYQPPTGATYSVSFTETGLPSGTSWSVTLNGATESATATTIVFGGLTNGSYPYTVGAVPGYTASPSAGSISVSGGDYSQPITFSAESTYAVTLTETGLPSGASWSVTLGGSLESSVTSSITFNEPNGQYSYSITAIPGYSTQYHGQVTVNGAPVSVSVQFTIVEYSVVFTETGLPSGTSWSVTLNGATQASTTSTLTFTEPNGTIPYSIADVPGWHQSALPYTGSVTVDGTVVTEPTLAFGPATYAVTFLEAGLTSGISWSVTLNGVTEASTATTLTFAEPNGTVSYSIGDVSGWHQATLPYAGSVTVAGGAVTEPALEFTQLTYSVTFSQTGLPSGTSWSVTLNGATVTSTTSSLAFTEPNGTYSYSIGGVPGWHQPSMPYAGSVTVNGSAVSYAALAFSEFTYAVTFTEFGLPSGTLWYVNVTSGPSYGSTTDVVTLAEPNGTFAYTAATGAMYNATSPGGTVRVAGAAVGASIAFVGTFEITFNRPSGMPAGGSWTVYLNSTTGPSIVRTASTGSLTIRAPNGTYSYSIVVPGNPSLASQGTVAVQGSNVVANPSSATPSRFLGFSGNTGYYILAAVIVGLALVAIWALRRRPGSG
ncbi:MAG TPA: protease pro-enzyme activation domain-containing protein [Thermoplasmata archaeon]|nr:protease pro-enzyme activation domain-containing protein [Thermoplasmata archaeon]